MFDKLKIIKLNVKVYATKKIRIVVRDRYSLIKHAYFCSRISVAKMKLNINCFTISSHVIH